MIDNVYNTTALKRIDNKRTIRELEIAKAEGTLIANFLPNHSDIYAVVSNKPNTRDIPPFNHPISLSDGSIIIDLRAWPNLYNRDSDSIMVIKSGPSWTLMVTAILIKGWVTKDMRERLYSSVSILPAKTFVSWLFKIISRKLRPEPIYEEKIRTLLGWYYRCLFFDNNETLDEDLLYKLAGRLERLSFEPIESKVELLDQVGYLHTLEDLVKALQGLGSKKLETMTVGLMYTLVSGHWFGTMAAKEIVSAGIEFPPLWLAMINSALTERMYRKLEIAETAQSLLNRNLSEKEFTVSFNNLLREISDE